MNKPFFSIVITAYNAEKYIKQCILSVINQNFGDFEIIITEDCSSDNTLKAIEEFDDLRIKTYKTPKNMGVSFCRNYGLKKASGEYIFFIDADDFLDETILKRAYDELTLNPSDMLIFPYRYFEENRVKKENPKCALKSIANLKKPFSADKAAKKLFKINYEIWNKIFNSEFLCNNSIFFKDDLSFSEDLVFYFDVLKCAKTVTYLEEVGYYYRFFSKKKFDGSYVASQFEKALYYIKDTVVEKTNEEYYTKKISSILNYWIIKLDYDRNLYELALKSCSKKGIININNRVGRVFHKFYCKLENIS